MKTLLVCFAAGALGALVNSLALWQAGQLGIAHWARVAMAPALSAGWLYPRIVWGGLFGVLFALPFLKSRVLLKGTLLSLVPTAFLLFYLYPLKWHRGMLGMNLGMWTPAYVLVANWIWGVATALALRFAK